jgi:hypothetical protein
MSNIRSETGNTGIGEQFFRGTWRDILSETKYKTKTFLD